STRCPTASPPRCCGSSGSPRSARSWSSGRSSARCSAGPATGRHEARRLPWVPPRRAEVLFVRHATTPGTRAACFPTDEDADTAGLTRATALTKPARGTAGTPDVGLGPAGFAGVTTAWTAPVRAARQTAAALGLAACEAVALGEADCGRWRGLPYERVAEQEPDAIARWLADPDAAPHGGEPLTAHAATVARWLAGVRE